MNAPDLTTQLRDDGVEEWLVEAVERLARRGDRSLEPYLVTIGETPVLADTRATCRCHFVRIDQQGRPRVHALINMLSDQVVDYCIPRSRIDEAREHLLHTNSTDKILQLQREAKDLFSRTRTSGEGGELLLYTLLEIALGLPQVLCKMPLKTNPQVHYHGVDGVHAKGLPDGKLAVYWGEAKLYADVDAGIDAAMTSLAPFLIDAGDGASQRDLLLLRQYADTGDQTLTDALARYFSEDTVEGSQLVVRGACLIGFSMNEYPRPFGDDGRSVRAEVAEAISRWHQRLGAAIANEKLAAFDLEVFFVPLPSVQEFRDLLRKRLGLGE